MSGHSKWATIRHKKGAADAKRGKIFSKLAKELMVVAKRGGGNPDDNPALRMLMQKCKSVNMPNDNIDRAIKKGTGELTADIYEEVVYEGYAGGGIGLVVHALTDNKNRAAAEIRHVFGKFGSGLATQGSVSRNFERKGQIRIPTSAIDEEKLMALVIDAGADDMSIQGDSYEIATEPSVFSAVTEALEKAGIEPTTAEVTLMPMTTVSVSDKSQASSVLRFVSALEDCDDVQEVYHNMDMSDELIKTLSEEDE